MVPQSKRRVQIYSAVLGVALLLLAYTLARSAFAALHRSGFGAAWVMLLATVLVAALGLLLLIYAWRVAPLRLPQMPKLPPPGSAKRSAATQADRSSERGP